METRIMNVDTGKVVIKDNCLAWIGKSTKRKSIINKILDKFCCLDFGEVTYSEKFQNDFIMKREDDEEYLTSYITLTGRYPLNDGTVIIQRDRKDNIFEIHTKIDFIAKIDQVSDGPTNPVKVREGNLIKFDFAR